MKLRIATPHQAARLTIYLTNIRNPQSPTIQSLMTMSKAAPDPLAERITFDSIVAEMHLSLINQNLIVNQRLKNTNLVLIT